MNFGAKRQVTGICTGGGAVSGVRTSQGEVSAPVVVNAAGPWAASIAHMAGVDLPVQPLRRMLVLSEPFPGLPERLPMMIDMSTGWHFRQEGLGLLMAWAHPDEEPGFRTDFDPAYIEKSLTHAASRVPDFANLTVNPRRCWAGMYAMSPDHHAILGPSPQVRGFYFANGFSGHGVMHSPATGRILADLILHGETSVIDAKDLNVQRFTEGRAIEETAIPCRPRFSRTNPDFLRLSPHETTDPWLAGYSSAFRQGQSGLLLAVAYCRSSLWSDRGLVMKRWKRVQRAQEAREEARASSEVP